MCWKYGVLANCLLFGLLTGTISAQQRTVPLDPLGKPDGQKAKVKAVSCFIWYEKDKDTWHVKTDTGGKLHKFDGTITVNGGKVLTISEHMESASGKVTDRGGYNDARNRIWFKMATGKGTDEFSFRLDDDADRIAFAITIDGDTKCGGRILIGAKETPAGDSRFGFAAHPGRKPKQPLTQNPPVRAKSEVAGMKTDNEWKKVPNLLVNGSFEDELTEGQIPGWKEEKGMWGRRGGPSDKMQARDGKFVWAKESPVGVLSQDRELSQFVPFIRAHKAEYLFTCFVSTFPEKQSDTSEVLLQFLNDRGQVLHTVTTHKVVHKGEWKEYTFTDLVPHDAVTARVTLEAVRDDKLGLSGKFNEHNNGSFDALSLKIRNK